MHQVCGLRFPGNDRTDKVNKSLILLYGIFIMDLSRRSIKTNNWSADNFKKHVTSMNCTLQPAIQSCDTGQWVPFLKAVN